MRAGLEPAVTGATVDARRGARRALAAAPRRPGRGLHRSGSTGADVRARPSAAASSCGSRWSSRRRERADSRGARHPPRHERPGAAARPDRAARPAHPHRARARASRARTAARRLRRPAHLRLDGDRRPGADGRRSRRSSCRARSRTSPATRSTRSSTTRRSCAALARKQTTIKRALLDQTLISGIGNIYADEALWAARVHYDQPTATLSRAARARRCSPRCGSCSARRSPRAARASTRST